MATQPKRACRICNRTDCTGHSVSREKQTTGERGLGHSWRKLRSAKLAMTPFCELRTHCQGAIGTEVDHRIPRVLRPDLALDIDNLQTACGECHAAKSARERRGDLKPSEKPDSVPYERITF